MIGGPEFRLMCFCNGIQNGLTHYDDPDFFEKLLGKIGECEGDNVMFRAMDDRDIRELECREFYKSDDMAGYLFDQVELFNKVVKSVSFNEGHYRLNDKNITFYTLNVWLGEREVR